MSTGRVGAPLHCNEIRLRDWNEAGYNASNDPPQGEILIGGGNVTMGYYKNRAKTAEDFIKIGGVRYFCLKIINRKKDLVKMQAGEYVSLGKVETALKMSPLVENCCVVGDSLKDYVIVLVVAKKAALMKFADTQGIPTSDWSAVCTNKEVMQFVTKSMLQAAKTGGLQKFEIPRKLHICDEEWTNENGILTDALKVKRNAVKDQYRDVIGGLYTE